MKISLLEPDSTALEFVRYAVQRGHVVSRQGANLEEADVVVVGRLDSDERQGAGELGAGETGAGETGTAEPEAEARIAQLRAFVQAGIPLVVCHPACPVIPGFELQMIQQDTQSLVIPYFPGCDHPAIGQLGDWIRDPENSPIGPIEQLQFRRSMTARDKRSVLAQFSRDAYLLRTILGVVHRIGGSLSEKRTTDFSNLLVHMSGEQGVVATWSLNHGGPPTAALSITGHGGTAHLLMPLEAAAWDFKMTPSPADPGTSGPSPQWETSTWQPAAHTLTLLETILADPPAPDQTDQPANTQTRSDARAIRNAARQTADDRWEHACRAEEMADAVEVSCRKGKTLDLYQQSHTEEDTFKTLMAAGGCGALLFCLALLLAFALFDSLQLETFAHERWSQWPLKAFHPRAWPLYVLSGLAVFLALQALKLVFPKQA